MPSELVVLGSKYAGTILSGSTQPWTVHKSRRKALCLNVGCIRSGQCPLMCAAGKCRDLNEPTNCITAELRETRKFHCDSDDLPDPVSGFSLS